MFLTKYKMVQMRIINFGEKKLCIITLRKWRAEY